MILTFRLFIIYNQITLFRAYTYHIKIKYYLAICAQSHLLVLQLRLQLFVILDLPARLHKVLLNTVVPVFANGEHTGLSAHVSQVSAIELLANLSQSLEINVSLCCNGFRMDFQDFLTSCFIRQWNLDLSVESSRSKQCRIQNIRPVCCHNHLNSAKLVESIKLVQQLHQSSLHLSVCRITLTEPPASNRVDFVHEDDAGFVISCIAEHFSNNSRRLSNVFVDNC